MYIDIAKLRKYQCINILMYQYISMNKMSHLKNLKWHLLLKMIKKPGMIMFYKILSLYLATGNSQVYSNIFKQ